MSEQRNRPRTRDVPAGLAQVSAGHGVPLSAVQPVESFRRAQLVEGLGGLSAPDVRSYGVAGIVVEQRLEGLVEGGVRVGFRRGGPHGLRRSSVRPLHDVFADEAVAVPLHRTDEGRLARIVAQRASEDPDRLAQSTVADHHVAPDRVEELMSRHRLVPPLDEQDEQVEAARDQRQLPTVADERPAGGGQGVTGETGSGVNRGTIASTVGSICGLAACARTTASEGSGRLFG